ncbi:MAG: 2-phospho-L-lactate transferase [Candidatus Heimdallarchaeota archaeon]
MLVILSGGSGTPKFLDGLSEVLPAHEICVIVNTADDFYFYGLRVCPDLDSVLYVLAGLLDKTKWWGLDGDTFRVRDALHALGEDVWFNLGDKDLALSLLRTHLLAHGKTLSEITEIIRKRLDITQLVLPMTNDLVQTFISTPKGRLHFQEWWVKYKGQPTVLEIEFNGINKATPSERVIGSIKNADAVIIGPSNPVTSIGPILSVPGIRSALEELKTPVLAISPFIGTKPISGPAGTLLSAQNLPVHSNVLIRLYKGFLDALLVDPRDIATVNCNQKEIHIFGRNPIMRSRQEEIDLARDVLRFLRKISPVRR